MHAQYGKRIREMACYQRINHVSIDAIRHGFVILLLAYHLTLARQ